MAIDSPYDRRRQIRQRSRPTVTTSPPSTVDVLIPSSDVFPVDLWHLRRGWFGGHLSRQWLAFVVAGVTYVRSFRHDDPGADPTEHVPSLASAVHRYVELGASSVSAEDVADAVIASLALDGVDAVSVGAGDGGRWEITVTASSLVLPAAVATDNRLRGMFGFQRDDWGAGAGADLNATGGTNGTGSIYIGNPSSQSGMAGRAGRILGVYLWGRSSFPPLLGVSRGPAYTAAPTSFEVLGEAIADPITDLGAVLLPEPVAFASTDELWAHYRDGTVGGPRYRLHSATPSGNGDFGTAQVLVWDTTNVFDNGEPLAGSGGGASDEYVPSVDNTFPIHIAIGIIFELQDADGNYPSDAAFDTWNGDQNTDPTHGTQFAAGPALLDNETTHHRFVLPDWTNYGATQYRRAYAAIAADEDSRIAFYGPWLSLAFPASPAPALLRDCGMLGAAGQANVYTTLTLASRLELGTEVLGVAPIVSVGANYSRDGGGANTVITLPVYLDQSTGDGSWLNCWIDDRALWHDDIIGASGSRAYTSGVTEYRTISTPGMPVADWSDTFPNPMAVAVGNDSPNAIAAEAYRIQRAGFAAAA